jgi:hypothetical protein
MDFSQLDPRLGAMLGQMAVISGAPDARTRDAQYEVLASMLADVKSEGGPKLPQAAQQTEAPPASPNTSNTGIATGHVLCTRFFKLTACVQVLISEADGAEFQADVGKVVEVVAYVEPSPEEGNRWENICKERGYTEPSGSTISQVDVQHLRREVRIGDLVRINAFQEGFATRSNRGGFAYDGTRKRLRIFSVTDFKMDTMQDWELSKVNSEIDNHSDHGQFVKERKPRAPRPKREHNPDAESAHGKKGQLYERANVFAKWLLLTFGAGGGIGKDGSEEGDGTNNSNDADGGSSADGKEERGAKTLNSGSGVLDIAGGRGDLSSALSGYGVASTVVDPRPKAGNLTKKTRRRMTSQANHQNMNRQSSGQQDNPVPIARPVGKFSAVHVFFGTHLLAPASSEATNSPCSSLPEAVSAPCVASVAYGEPAAAVAAADSAGHEATVAAEHGIHLASELQIPKTCKMAEVAATTPEQLAQIQALIQNCSIMVVLYKYSIGK